MRSNHFTAWFILLILLSLLSITCQLLWGDAPISFHAAWRALHHLGTQTNQAILLDLRLPRAINACVVGAMLALAGLLMQARLQNPLADPYILGISSGSAVACLIAISLFGSSVVLGRYAFIGGIISMLIVIGLNARQAQTDRLRLLLTGVVFAAACSAVISLILSLSSSGNLRSMVFWLTGDIVAGPVSTQGIMVLALGLAICFAFSKPLDLLAFGDDKAESLGLNPKRLNFLILIVAALLSATAVSIAGAIGFIGLIAPHCLRLLGITKHSQLAPLAALLGASLLGFADWFSHMVIAPQILPTGVITALIGVPLFLILLSKRRVAC
jgi:iron complex transport system permease protein